MDRSKLWALLAIVLAIIAATGGMVAWARYGASRPIEVSLTSRPQPQGDIYVGGAVNAPGFYPLKAADSVDAIVRDAGGAAPGADLSHLSLYVNTANGTPQPQKVDINRAEAWLLQALPGIGATRAQAIVDYRGRNGPFRNTAELTRVEGIGSATYDRIKDMVTVGD